MRNIILCNRLHKIMHYEILFDCQYIFTLHCALAAHNGGADPPTSLQNIYKFVALLIGTANDLEEVTQSEVIKYSAGGFRDFTRIAASDPVMWRDIFLSNKDAVLDMLQRFSEDLTALQRAIRYEKGEDLEALFSRTRDIRRSIVEQGQDDEAPDFGRKH